MKTKQANHTWKRLKGNRSFWQPVATGPDRSFLNLVNPATGNWTGHIMRQLATAVQLPTSPVQSSCQSFYQSATGLQNTNKDLQSAYLQRRDAHTALTTPGMEGCQGLSVRGLVTSAGPSDPPPTSHVLMNEANARFFRCSKTQPPG
jgi:hypothetical protein